MDSKIAVRFKNNIPNILTSLRVVLVVMLNYFIVKDFGNMIIPIVITSLVFLSDYFDGKIARRLSLESNTGAILDVTADLIYIAISYIVLYTFDILPLWFLFIILYKFAEFIITSKLINKFFSNKSILIFDSIGRVVAVIFYIIPIVTYVSYNLAHNIYLLIVNVVIYIVTLMVFVASSYRFFICFKV